MEMGIPNWGREELRVKLQTLLQDLKEGLEVSLDDLNEILTCPLSEPIFITQGDELIGYGEVLEWRSATGKAGYIENVVVAKSWQGKGVGKKLGLEMVRIMKRRNIHTLWLHTGEWRKSANALYKSLGFQTKDTLVYYLTAQ